MAAPSELQSGSPFQAPSAYLVDEDDYFRISVLGNGAQLVRVTGRILTFAGDVRPFQHDVVAPSSRTAPMTLIRQVGCGWLLNVTAISLSAVTGLAQLMVTVDLVRGPTGAGGVTATLVQGPVSSLQRIAWPGSLLLSSLDIAGVLRSITGTDPAAGVELSETVPAGARWRVRAIAVTLVVDVTVANREVSVTFDDGANVFYAASSGAQQAASTTRRYDVGNGSVRGVSPNANEILVAIPELWLPGGSRIKTVTTNLQAGDNFGAPQLLVEETLEGL